MIITLDGQRLEQDFAAGDTLQSIIEQVRQRLLGERLIVSVAVNGEHCAGDTLESSLGQAPQPSDQVDLESGDRMQITAGALRGIAREVDEAGQIIAGAADRMTGDGAGEALREVGQLLSVWNACSLALVQGGALLGRELLDEEYEGRQVREWTVDLAEGLRGLRDALTARDSVLLGDHLRYDVPDTCRRWCSLLNELADRVERG